MKKVANTYSNKTRTISVSGSKNARGAKRATPQWFVFSVIVSITFMLCIAINLRAFSEMSRETTQFQRLNTEIEQLNNENLLIQEEIHNLKSDSRIIEREARKIGMSRPNEKILVPVN